MPVAAATLILCMFDVFACFKEMLETAAPYMFFTCSFDCIASTCSRNACGCSPVNILALGPNRMCGCNSLNAFRCMWRMSLCDFVCKDATWFLTFNCRIQIHISMFDYLLKNAGPGVSSKPTFHLGELTSRAGMRGVGNDLPLWNAIFTIIQIPSTTEWCMLAFTFQNWLKE